MSNIMSLAKLFTPDSTANSKATDQDKVWPMFPLDAQINTEPLRVCKSLIPYLPFEKQKTICIFIKIYELMSVVDHFSDPDDPPQEKGYFRDSETWQADLLQSVKGSLDPQNAYWVDIFFKLKDVTKILEAANSGAIPIQAPTPATATDPPTRSKEFTENISPMLDDNQKKMLEMLSTIMK